VVPLLPIAVPAATSLPSAITASRRAAVTDRRRGEKTLVVEQRVDTYRTLKGETVRPDDLALLGAS
jgi:hypothetical protein